MGSSSCEGLREKLKTMAVHRQRGGLGLSVEPCDCRRIHSVLGEGGIAHVQALLRCPIIFAEAEDALSVVCVCVWGGDDIIVVVRFS